MFAACVFGDLLSPRAAEDLTVEITTDSLLTVGDTVRLVARAMAGTDQVRGVRFQFSSSRAAVATVDDSGRVAVLARDTFAIRATLRSGSLAGEPPETTAAFRGIVARVVASPDSLRFESLGDTARLAAQGQKKQGDAIVGVPITWTSERPTVASVDSTGLVRALANSGPPRVNVVARADGRLDTVRVGVIQISRSITLSRDTVILKNPGDTARVLAEPKDARGNLNTRSPATWTSTNAAVFTVDATGLLAATGEGIAAVVARSDGVADTGSVIVARGLASLNVTPDSSMLTAVGDQIVLAATGVDESNNPVLSPVMLWRSLDPVVATVNGAGVVTATSNGTARIVGSSGGREDTTVVVVGQLLAAVGFRTPANDTTLTSLGDTARFVAEGRDRNGFAIPADLCCVFAFTSDNSAVASVDPRGLVTAQTNGSATITVNGGGFEASRVVNVSQEVASVTVTPRRVGLLQGQRYLLTGAAFDARGNWIQGRGFTWQSRNSGVASVGSSGADSTSVQGGNVNDSTYVVATTAGRSDSALVRVGSLAALCPGGTPRQGAITSSQTWTRAQSPHCVGGVTIRGGATVTIEAGATVKFAAGTEMAVGVCCSTGDAGRIRANGTAALPITFTALDANPTRGNWRGVRTYWVAPNDSLIFRYVTFEYGGGSEPFGGGGLEGGTIANDNTCQGTIVLDNVTIRESTFDGVNTACNLRVTGSQIRNVNRRGIWSSGNGTTSVTDSRIERAGAGLAVSPGTLTALTGTVITNTSDRPVRVSVPGLNAIQDVTADNLMGNALDEIAVEGIGDLKTRDLFIDRRVPWFLDGAGIGIGSGRTLTVDAGTTIRAVGGSTIYVGASSSDVNTDIGGGRIVADGRFGEIHFTSGQPNPQPGDWGLIWLKRLSDTTIFRNVVLEYGGPCCTGGHILAQHTGAPLVLDLVTSRHSRLQGLRVDGPLIVQGPIYADSNATDGMELRARDVTIPDSRFVGNGGDGLVAFASAKRLGVNNALIAGNAGDGAVLSGDSTAVDNSAIRDNGGGGLALTPDRGGSPPPRYMTLRGSAVERNGADGVNVSVQDDAVVENNLIADNAATGLALGNVGGAASRFAGNRIRGNQYPARLTSNSLGPLAAQDPDSLLGNSRDTLWITCCGDISATDTVRTVARLPWRFDAPGFVYLVNGTVWKLEPGATIVINGGVLVVDNGTMRAEGEATNPITFTSDNRNPGAWSYLDFQTRADTNVLRHVELRYGGGGAGFALRVAGAPSNPVVLDNVRVTRSSAAGIQIDNEALIPTRVVADSNAGDGMRTQWSGKLIIPDGDFSYNGGHGFFATSDLADSIQINGGRFSGNGQSGIKLCGDDATIRNATLTRNFGSGLEVAFGGCPGGGTTLTNYLVDGVRADSNGNGITYLAGSSMRVRNSRIVANAGSGLNIGVGLEEFTGNRVTLNGTYPISIGAYGLQALEDQDVDSMLGNGIDQIFVQQEGVIANRNVTIRQRLPWRVQAFVTVGGGRTLTVEPGTTVVMDGGGAGLWIGGGPSGGEGRGRLLAEGTAINPIRFVAASPTNRWHVLAISEQSDTSKLRHTRIEYGGNSGWPGALTISDAIGRPVILEAVTVRQSAGVGINAANIIVQGPIYADSNGGRGMLVYGRDVTLADSRFVGNGGDGLWSSSTARKLTLRRSLLYRNANAGAQLNGDSTTIDSTTIRRNGTGISLCCDGNNPARPSLLRSVVDSNTTDGVSTSGAVSGIVRDNQIIANGGVGLTHHNGGLVSGNRVRGNGRSINLNPGGIAAITGQSIDSLLGNVGDTLTVECCSGEEVIASDTIRTRPELPWRIDVSLRFIDRTVWTIEPGSSVFLNGGRIQIGQNPSCNPATQGAVLLAESDDTAPIRFTSRNQTRGVWAQILLECLSDTTKLRNVEIAYAGAGGDNAVRIAPGTAGVPVILDSVRVRQSGGTGLLIQNGTNVVVQRYLAADSNNSEGLYVEPDGIAIPAGRFVGNGGRGVAAYGRRFSLTGALVRGNGGRGVEINADSATVTGIRSALNPVGIVIQSSQGHLITGSTLDSNAGAGLEAFGGPLRFTNNGVFDNAGDGVFGNNYRTFSEFSGNTISRNGGYPVQMDGGSLGAFAAQDPAALLGNTRDTVCLCQGPQAVVAAGGSPTITAQLPWKNQLNVILGGDQTLTMNPGATLVMESGASLSIGTVGDPSHRGRLLALGTAASPVRIVGLNTSPGAWRQLAIGNQTDSSILRHVEIAHGGGFSVQQGLYLGDYSGNPIRLDTVTVRESFTNGVWIAGDAPVRIASLRSLDNVQSGVVIAGGTVNLAGNRYERNGRDGVYLTGGLNHVISGSILASNGRYGLFNDTANNSLAENNWWGSDQGPGAGGNNPVNGPVDFTPWLMFVPIIP